MRLFRRIIYAAAGVSLGILSAATAAQAAPYDISPQRVAGAYAADGLHVFVRGTTGYVYQKLVSPAGQQSAWAMMGTQVASSPAAAVDEDRRVYVAARASNGNVLLRWREPTGAWTAWHNIGGTTYGAPSLQAAPEAGDGEDAYLAVAALTASGTIQVRLFKPGTLLPPSNGASWTGWRTVDGQVTTAAPMLSLAHACTTPFGLPNVAYVQARTANGTGVERPLCLTTPGGDWRPTVSDTTASGISYTPGSSNAGHNMYWYRGTDGALWASGVRVGVPADGRRLAGTPTVAGYRMPPLDIFPMDPLTVLVRDDQGGAWIYQPPSDQVGTGDTGGTWTSLGGVAT
ncbi:hypothetical protein [Fodinicola acaciae]|uniref:hypothetical protein n=1 Tax=Fodinicola acaciae TaxID=2681555 RepID=UPI0013D03C80|nr:hypothetical protein [Fodinicola acaciae]